MLTVKLLKYGPTETPDSHTHVEHICLRLAKSVHVSLEPNGLSILQFGDIPGEDVESITVGSNAAAAYNVAYVMNELGRTVETIR